MKGCSDWKISRIIANVIKHFHFPKLIYCHSVVNGEVQRIHRWQYIVHKIFPRARITAGNHFCSIQSCPITKSANDGLKLLFKADEDAVRWIRQQRHSQSDKDSPLCTAEQRRSASCVRGRQTSSCPCRTDILRTRFLYTPHTCGTALCAVECCSTPWMNQTKTRWQLSSETHPQALSTLLNRNPSLAEVPVHHHRCSAPMNSRWLHWCPEITSTSPVEKNRTFNVVHSRTEILYVPICKVRFLLGSEEILDRYPSAAVSDSYGFLLESNPYYLAENLLSYSMSHQLWLRCSNLHALLTTSSSVERINYFTD